MQVAFRKPAGRAPGPKSVKFVTDWQLLMSLQDRSNRLSGGDPRLMRRKVVVLERQMFPGSDRPGYDAD